MTQASDSCAAGFCVTFDKSVNIERPKGQFIEAAKTVEGGNYAICYRGIAYLLLDYLKEAESDCARCRELGGKLKPEAERLLREARQKHKATVRSSD